MIINTTLVALFKKLYQKLKTHYGGYCNHFYIQSSQKKFKIFTTRKHPLKKYLKTIRLYDRFLPFLIRNTGSGMIDIGSNIGDSMLLTKSIFENCDLVCVEPDIWFTKILKKNIKQNKIEKVNVYPYPITTQRRSVTIEKNKLNSTGNLIDVNNVSNAIESKTFFDLVYDMNIEIDKYKTIKIDTDGYDWDVLNSIYEFCLSNENHFDFIFYEHQTRLNLEKYNDPRQLEREIEFIKVLLKLRKIGYVNYYIFDNYGTFILKTCQIDILKNIVEYIRRTTMENNRHTIHFCDVLICKDNNLHIADKSILEYVENGIKVS